MSELTPITRIESYLDAIVNSGTPPLEDITRIETFLQAIYDNTVCQLTPITRIEMFLGKISGQSLTLPEPITRIELYLAAIAGEDVELPENPITRLEMYLAEWADSGDWATISGAIVEFITQRAHKLKSCVVSLSPIQDLSHGDPSPTNICPISGWTGCEVWRTGKNLYNPEETEQNKWVTDQGIEDQNNYWLSGYILLKANQPYIRSQTGSGRCAYFDLDKNFKEYFVDYSLTITPTEDCYLRFAGNGATYPADGEIQFEVGTTATSFEEYKGNSFPVIWDNEAGTVYKGELNLTTGELTATHALLTKNTATMNNSENFPGWTNAGVRDLMGTGIDSVYINQILNIGTSFAVNTTYDILYLPYSGSQGYTMTQSQFIALAIDVQVLIPLAIPITIQLTPQQITSLKGYNAMWSNAGNVTVTFRGTPIVEPDAEPLQALNLLLGGAYRNDQTPEDVPDDEALEILLGGGDR